MPFPRPILCAAIVVLLNVGAIPLATAQQSAEQELAAFEPAEGFDVSVFASEPMITNPAAIDVDTHGRVWVAEIQWYRASAKAPPADKIKVLEDTDGDGRADRETVFADGLFCPMSICVAGDKVYVATSPDLWVYEDKDGDLKADGPPRKLLTGFGGRNHDHGAHSLVLGPDHKWWMAHGDRGFDVEGTDGSKVAFQWGAVLRGELDGSQLEMVAANFRNPYEVCVSSFGEAFLSDNDNDGLFSTRICWILDGGDYGWFGRPGRKVPRGTPFGEHWHFRGQIPGFVPATLVTGFGSPCGICFYEGDAFGEHYKNLPAHADAGPREVRVYRHVNEGAGMKAESEVILTSASDKYFRPDDVCAAPDGSLLVSDWYDGGVGGHAYNNPNEGRIFLLRPKGKKLERLGSAGPFSTTAAAIEGLKNPNLATQYLARERLLADKAASIESLVALLSAEDPNYAARALWVLDRLGGDAQKKVVEQLTSDSSRTRALAVRILRRRGTEFEDAILALASDPDAEVRREVLLALRNYKGAKAEAVLEQLAATYDGNDRYLLEAIHIAAGDRGPAVVSALQKRGWIKPENIDLVQALDPDVATELIIEQFRAGASSNKEHERMLMRLGTINSIAAAEAVLQTAADPTAATPLRKQALEIVEHNIGDTWKKLSGRRNLPKALKEMLDSPALRGRTIDLIMKQNVSSAAPLLLAVATSTDVSARDRAKALRGAARMKAEGVQATCEELMSSDDKAIRDAAVHGLVDLQDWEAIKRVLSSDNVPEGLKVLVAESAIDDTRGALVLLQLVESGTLPDEVRAVILRQAVKHADANVRMIYDKFIPEDQRPKRLGTAVTADDILALKGDAVRGSKIFFKSSAARCKSCHLVNGFGNTIGPDLSQIGKKYERRALLETILEPSKAIGPEYVVYLVETSGGEVHAGFIVEQSDKELVLKNAKGELIHVPAAEVVGTHPQQQSMMPELVLQDITAQDAADLLEFLVSLINAPQEEVVDQ